MNKKFQTKYICPKCGSKNVVVWEENVIEHLYCIKKDGNSYKRPFSKEYKGDVLSGLKCMDCLEYENFMEDKEIAKWEVDQNL